MKKIATIINDTENVSFNAMYDKKTGKITYELEDGTTEDAGETAANYEEACDLIGQAYVGWMKTWND